MDTSISEKLLAIVPEKEEVVRQLINIVGNDRTNLIRVSEVIEHIAIKEHALWAYNALDLLDEESWHILKEVFPRKTEKL